MGSRGAQRVCRREAKEAEAPNSEKQKTGIFSPPPCEGRGAPARCLMESFSSLFSLNWSEALGGWLVAEEAIWLELYLDFML